ncbi:MAG: PAS domain S-box protein, partial [Desulfoprunum sp.]|nr:PAS domain S-box protein [Desulfoprunum sp.]
EFVSNVYLVDHQKVIQCNIRDITATKAERKRLMAAIEQVGEAVVITDTQGVIQYVNPAFEQMTGYSREEAVGRNPSILSSGKQDELFYRNLWNTISGGRTWVGRLVNKRKDGTLYTEETTISPVHDPLNQIVNYIAVKRDITSHLRLVAQFQQAQKMEAVGILAGGVAHDYNNMLGVILGYSELALNKINPSEPLYNDLQEILKAAERSKDITRQLLAFARKQTIIPVVLDLNRNVENMLKMLRRLIGEDIDLAWRPGVDLCPIKMDPIQVDQILANLCVNARDAIAGVGKITIETGSAVFDEKYCANHVGFVAGKYVLLVVSDDGCGMDNETINQIFEPFFTSKRMGQGTGLGLSTVYGIVKQNNGFINVYSEPGKGTTVTIYLPRNADQTVDAPQERMEEIPLGGGETVLVVEDEAALLKMSKRMLEKLGYRVLAAGTPGEAIGLTEEHAGEIRLVITDVVMPEMNGRDLAERLQALCPSMKILFMSGYTANVIVHRGVLDDGINFIQKPYSMEDLAIKVREVLRQE